MAVAWMAAHGSLAGSGPDDQRKLQPAFEGRESS